MAKHTPEPWAIDEDEPRLFGLPDPDGGALLGAIGEAYGWRDWTKETATANAARIVACVNALAGRDPEKLEALVEALLFWRAYATSNEAAVRLDAALAAFLGEGDES